jgi:small conductance mechanosensitive channel
MDSNAPIPYIGLTPVKIAWALLVLIVGIILVKIVVYVFKKSLKRAKLPPILMEFLARFLGALLYVFVILAFVGALGFNMDSVVLGLSAVIGLILAFGLQDSFMNMAAGFWIASIRPFNKDDVISTQGMTGKVSAVGIMSTEMLTPDNTYITIPNKLVWGSPVINYTRQKTRRVDVNVGIGYGMDVNKAIQIAMDVMRSDKRILTDPAPSVFVVELADSSVNLQLRPWTKTSDYWAVRGDLTQKIYEAFRKEGIEIPFPQLDVNIKNEN